MQVQMESIDSLDTTKSIVESLAKADTRKDAYENLGFTRLCHRVETGVFYAERVSDEILQVEFTTEQPNSKKLPETEQPTADELLEIANKNFSTAADTRMNSLKFWRDDDDYTAFRARISK